MSHPFCGPSFVETPIWLVMWYSTQFASIFCDHEASKKWLECGTTVVNRAMLFHLFHISWWTISGFPKLWCKAAGSWRFAAVWLEKSADPKKDALMAMSCWKLSQNLHDLGISWHILAYLGISWHILAYLGIWKPTVSEHMGRSLAVSRSRCERFGSQEVRDLLDFICRERSVKL